MAARRRELVSVDVEREVALGVLQKNRAARGDVRVRLQQTGYPEAPGDDKGFTISERFSGLRIARRDVV